MTKTYCDLCKTEVTGDYSSAIYELPDGNNPTLRKVSTGWVRYGVQKVTLCEECAKKIAALCEELTKEE